MLEMAKRANTATSSLEPASVSREPTAGNPVTLRRGWKLFFSLLIVIHLLAVVAEPFAFFTRGANSASPAAIPIRSILAPYVEFAYLNHGYFFFAPNPGPSHLLECQLVSANGEKSRLRLPDLQAQWPRLLYHRHFMLAEFLHQLHVPPVTPQVEATTPEKDLLAAWRTERSRFEMVRNSMIKHLLTRYDADSAEILRLEHRLPSDIEIFRDKLKLSDERLYVVLPDAPIEPPITPPPINPPLIAPMPEPVPKRSIEILRDTAPTKQPSASEQSPP